MTTSAFIVRLGAAIAQLLSATGPASKATIMDCTGASAPSVQRALTWLREEANAPVTYTRGHKRSPGTWSIAPGWSLPSGSLDEADLLQAWVEREKLRRLLEADDVVAEVESMILGGL